MNQDPEKIGVFFYLFTHGLPIQVLSLKDWFF